jgi:DNA-directed RNA polymerase subunit RPC12/RpoP
MEQIEMNKPTGEFNAPKQTGKWLCPNCGKVCDCKTIGHDGQKRPIVQCVECGHQKVIGG